MPFVLLHTLSLVMSSPSHSSPSSHPSSHPSRDRRRFAFTIRAAAEPETVPRVISPFAKRGLVPHRFSVRAGQEAGWLTVWAEIELPDSESADSIANTLRALMTVDAVLIEETNLPVKRRAPVRGFGAFAAG